MTMEDAQTHLAVFDERRAAMEVRSQVNQIQYLMQNVLIRGEHYGVIPGVSKPCLMQSGAEKICLMFKLVPHYEVKREAIEGFPGHREFTVTCTLIGPDGAVKGEAIASCSTMESRYRWRNGYEDTGKPIPDDAKQHKQEYRRQGFGMKKVNGNWLWVRYIDRQENPDIADVWNTCLQMAQKRAFVRATRSTTAASDIFTQDVDEMQTDFVVSESQPVYDPQQTYEPAPQQGSVDADKEELARLAESCVGDTHDLSSAKRLIWKAYRGGGIEAARQAASEVQTVVYEATDLDF